MKVRLVVDPPQPVRDQRAIGVEYRLASVSTWITGGMPPSLVRCSCGSTPRVPSWSDQKVHIATLSWRLPSRPLIVIAAGNSSRSQICLIPRARADHQEFAVDIALLGDDRS